ncbi:MAG: CBS domain-containing protein [Pseudonocardia sp.]|nr:CBS domain-containing protein [Pseudonocardia sp.]
MDGARRQAARPEVADDDDPFVAGLMTTPVVAIVPDAPLTVALRLLATRHVRHLPVVDGPRCLGIILDTDIAHLLAYTPAPMGVPPLHAADLCKAAPVVRPRDRRSTAAGRMRDSNVDAALVVDGDRLVGIVTSTDLVRSIAAEGASASPPS